MIKNVCKICGKDFLSKGRGRVVCGTVCRDKLVSINMKGKNPKNLKVLIGKGKKYRYKKGVPNGTKFHVDKSVLIDLYTNQLKSIEEISKLLSVGSTTVHNYLCEYGISRRPQGFQKGNILQVGDCHYRWKGGVSSFCNQIRSLELAIEWREKVFGRDRYTCQNCGVVGGKLNAHHIKPLHELLVEYAVADVESAKTCACLWDINNGITLCKKCHLSIHGKKRRKE